MSKKLMYLLLIISLAFNLAFIGMFVWHRLHMPPPPTFPADIRHFRENMGEHRKHINEHREKFLEERREFMDFLRGEEFEEAQADSLLRRMIEKQKFIEEELGRSMIEMRKNGEFFPERMDRKQGERRNKPERRRK
ncbi:MAG: periplasmic heavy metal sensor [Candidatus Cloacimonetes bacterium]|nr:periplasmic heavy metal sensor [Candidatus Cloacimonadota bacterium]